MPIKKYFENLFFSPENITEIKHTVELATAVLMIEISLADDHIHDEERRLIKTLLLQNFNISDQEIDELIELAEKEVDHATSLHDFTRLLNDHLKADDKIGVIENLWRVAYADSSLDKYEEYYIRKISDLLHVPHSRYIKAKLKAVNDRKN